jgi:hypothetical protein
MHTYAIISVLSKSSEFDKPGMEQAIRRALYGMGLLCQCFDFDALGDRFILNPRLKNHSKIDLVFQLLRAFDKFVIKNKNTKITECVLQALGYVWIRSPKKIFISKDILERVLHMDKSKSMKIQICKVLSEFLRMTETLSLQASEADARLDNLSKEEQYLSNAFHSDFAQTMGIMNT